MKKILLLNSRNIFFLLALSDDDIWHVINLHQLQIL